MSIPDNPSEVVPLSTNVHLTPELERVSEVVRAALRIWWVRGFPYLLFYRPAEPRPRVLRILHGARDLPEVLRDLGG